MHTLKNIKKINTCLTLNIFALTDKSKEALENYTELWDQIKNGVETY